MSDWEPERRNGFAVKLDAQAAHIERLRTALETAWRGHTRHHSTAFNDHAQALVRGEITPEQSLTEHNERIRREALEEAETVCVEKENYWNEVAYQKRQNDQSDNFACASASSATHCATAIRALINGDG